MCLPCSDVGSKGLPNAYFTDWGISNTRRDSLGLWLGDMIQLSWSWLRQTFTSVAGISPQDNIWIFRDLSCISRALEFGWGRRRWQLKFTWRRPYGWGECWPFCSWRRQTVFSNTTIWFIWRVGKYLHPISHWLLIPTWKQTLLSAYLTLLWLKRNIFKHVGVAVQEANKPRIWIAQRKITSLLTQTWQHCTLLLNSTDSLQLWSFPSGQKVWVKKRESHSVWPSPTLDWYGSWSALNLSQIYECVFLWDIKAQRHIGTPTSWKA